jgi:hypothetical protein
MTKTNYTQSNFILDGSKAVINGVVSLGSSMFNQDFFYRIAAPVTWPFNLFSEIKILTENKHSFNVFFVEGVNIAGLIYSKNFQKFSVIGNDLHAVFTGNNHDITGAVFETGLMLSYHGNPYGLPIAAVGLVGEIGMNLYSSYATSHDEL